MVGIIFNLAMVNAVLCMFTASLSDSEYMTGELPYIESITDATNDIVQIERKKNGVESTNYYFNKLFSASASPCSLIISAESTALMT